MKHSVEWWGKGRGVSRIMRKTGQRTGAQNPHTRGGRRAHGPKVAKDWSQKLNSKQKTIARNSAIAASADSGMQRDTQDQGVSQTQREDPQDQAVPPRSNMLKDMASRGSPSLRSKTLRQTLTRQTQILK